ncbi:MAG: aminopeptidase, partial [Thermoplasmata archaeon]
MVSDKKIKLCAKNIVEAMNLKKGDCVLIQGGVHSQRLLERCAIEVMNKGGSPLITSTSDRFMKEMFEEVPFDSFEVVPRHLVGATKELDVNLRIEPYEDPAIAHTFAEDKVKARMESHLPISEIIHDPAKGKKWLYAGWPTKGMAKMYGLDYSKLEKYIIDGMLIPYKELSDKGKRISGALSNAEYVHVKDKNGTDIKMRIFGRRANISDGYISEEDVARGQRGSNLPTGEVYYAPHEDSCEGNIYCPLT